MKKLIISFALLLLSTLAAMATHPELPEHHIAVPGADYSVYSGEINEETFVMKIWQRKDEVTGHYYRAKEGKMMRLTGEYDAATGWITLRESYQGETTGWWEFIAHDHKISGAWSKSIDLLGAKAFTAQALDITYDPDDLKEESVSGTYKVDHNTLKIQYVGGNQLSFHYQVKGVYGYTGSVNGIAELWDEGFAVFKDGENCTLSFEFKEGKVIVDEQTCKDYRGTLAYFSGELMLASR